MPTLKPNRALLFSPSSDNPDDADEESSRMEEERRCAYVAVTRTRRRLFLSYVARDDDAAMHLLPSRFLDEVRLSFTSSAIKEESEHTGPLTDGDNSSPLD